MANTYNKVMSVISKKPELRQDFEIQGIIPWLRKKSQLFSTLKTECLKDIVRNCGVLTYKRNDIIIKQGEIGDCFYIILGGKISIFIINKDKEGGGEGDERSAYNAIGTLDNDGKLDRSKLGNFVTSLGSGFPFGEVALVSDDAIRTASIIAEEDNTDLLVVDRSLYNRAVRDVLAAEFKEKRDFIKQNELLKSWIPKYKKQLAMAMYKETYPYDSVLVKQGDTVGNIYFVVSGQVEIRTDPSLHPLQYPKLYKLLEDERDKLIKEKKQKAKSDPENSPPPIRKKDNSKVMKMCYLGKNESLGELEVLMDMGTYMTTAICTERTEVLVLEMKHYERLFVKKHQRTIDAMRKNLEIKLNTRTSVLKDRGEILLLQLLQIQLDLIHNPPPTVAIEKKKKSGNSVQIAEKLFFSHQGPLFDIDGPGSVFYMIRAREKSRLKLKAHQKERNNKRENRGHLHTVRLPQSLMMAARIAGATENTEKDHTIITNSVQVKPNDAKEIDAVAEQNTPQRFELGETKRTHSAKSGREETILNSSTPKSFRRIQSAVKSKDVRPDDSENDQIHRSQDEYENRYTSRSRPFVEIKKRNGEENLQQLETKVEEWLRKDNPRTGTNVSKLRRVHVEAMEPRPKPGNKIVIRRRSKGNHSDSSTATGNSDVGLDQPVKRPSFSSHFSNTSNIMDRYKILLTS